MAEVRAMQQQLDDQRRKVDVDNYTITVRELLGMAERNELRRAPEYQRKFRWPEESESRLIESILLGLPIPNLFFATNEDGSWEVVDGLQRISTLIHFASESKAQLTEIGKTNHLVLRELKKLSEFNGVAYADLPPALKFTFTKRGLGVTALSDKSDQQARFDTFERLNRGSVELSKQEVRACIYDGPFNSLLRKLAENHDFRELVKLQEKNQENATHEELVLKFFAYYHNRDAFTGAVHDFLNAYMEDNRYSFDLEVGEKRFNAVVSALKSIIGGPLLRRNTPVTPQNELEAVMVASADVLDRTERIATPPRGWLDDPELVEASTGATNTRQKLSDRIRRATELLSPEA